MSGPGLTRRIINAAAVAPMPAEISRCYEQIKKMDGETCGKRLDFACNCSRLRLCGLAELAVRVREGLHAWQALPATEKLQDGEALESMVRVDLASRAELRRASVVIVALERPLDGFDRGFWRVCAMLGTG